MRLSENPSNHSSSTQKRPRIYLKFRKHKQSFRSVERAEERFTIDPQLSAGVSSPGSLSVSLPEPFISQNTRLVIEEQSFFKKPFCWSEGELFCNTTFLKSKQPHRIGTLLPKVSSAAETNRTTQHQEKNADFCPIRVFQQDFQQCVLFFETQSPDLDGFWS